MSETNTNASEAKSDVDRANRTLGPTNLCVDKIKFIQKGSGPNTSSYDPGAVCQEKKCIYLFII